jgi:AcrR family transcriptional regulator
MMKATRPAARPKLPKGRHPLTRQAVAASQRARMLDALALAVAEKGYAVTSVADVVERAWVSRRTFYEIFPDKEACFLAAYDEGKEYLLGSIREALRGLPEKDWRARSSASIRAYLRALAARPAAAWAFSIEVFGAGSKALARHAAIIERWVAQWRRLRQLAKPGRASASEDARLRVLVGGIEELVRECLRTRGAGHLEELAPSISAIAVSMLES